MVPTTQRQTDDFEPLLIPTLRVLIALPLIMSVIPILLHWLLPAWFEALSWVPDHVQRIPTVFLLFEGLALLVLYLPGLQDRLGKWLLPAVILLSTLGLLGGMIGQLSILRAAVDQISVELSAIPFAYSFWPPAFFALIPMVVVAWQYRFRDVVLYALGLVAAELLIIMVIFWGAPGSMYINLVQVALFRTIIFLTTGYLVSQLVASQRLQRAELERANARLAAHALTQEKLAVSQERNRLARDLHDTLAHYLSGLVLELEGTRLLWDTDNGKARQNLDESIATARSGLLETRRALQALRAAPLDDLGLIGAVRELARNSAERNRWRLELDLPVETLSLPPATEGVLYRVAQEALTNIERHAGAQFVRVCLGANGDNIRLEITDDGVGYRPDDIVQTEQFGISGMAERTAMVGGALQVDSRPGQGARVLAAVPSGQASAVQTMEHVQ